MLKFNEPNPANEFFGKNSKYSSWGNEWVVFGEFNKNNEITGKGIKMHNGSTIRIGYWLNDDPAPGKYIVIGSSR